MIIGARCQFFGEKPLNRDSVFDIAFVDYEIRDGYCQMQMNVTRREGFDFVTIDWGDGTVVRQTDYLAWHNYTRAGRFTVRIGYEAKWWRLVDCYTVTADRRVLVSRPAIFPKCWSDWLESAEGTYCGWSNGDHGGVQGRIIPWGKSITSTFCCYQFCSDVTGGFQQWTPAITDATGTYDRCTGLSGRIPKWGPNITKVAQCYCDCPGATGPFIPWPPNCTAFNSCYKNDVGLSGTIPAWPDCGREIDSVFEGCTGARGSIPAWPNAITMVSRCFYGCAGLTDAWTHDPALLMPEEKVRHSPDSDYYRCYDVVTGCAESLRALFWDKNWGGTIPRPTPIPEGT